MQRFDKTVQEKNTRVMYDVSLNKYYVDVAVSDRKNIAVESFPMKKLYLLITPMTSAFLNSMIRITKFTLLIYL